MTKSAAVFLFLGLFLLAPARAEDPPAPAAKKSAVLRLKFRKDAKLRFRTRTEQVTSTEVFRQTQTIVQENTWTVKEVAEDGTGTLEISFDHIKFESENPMAGKTTFDSKAEDAKEKRKDPRVAPLAAMLGKSFTMQMTPRAKVVKVTGFEAMMKDALEGNPMWEMMKEIFSDESMAEKMQATACEFPEGAVKVGDTWKHSGKMNLGLMGSLTISGTYTLKEVKESEKLRTARIGWEAALGSSSLKAPAGGGMGITFTLTSGKLSGEIVLDLGKGAIRKTSYTITMDLEAGGQKIRSEMKMEQVLIE